jgi:catechol 2,3-dioxygenase-like lactoylglutathione lyase family enzyme
MSKMMTRAQISEVGRVMVPVTDQDRALEFYIGTLGFEKRADTPFGKGDRWIEVAPPGAPTAIALVKPPEGMPVGIDTNIALSSGDVDATHEYLRSQGVEADEEVMRMGDPVPPMFFFRDPDGNRLLIVEPDAV